MSHYLPLTALTAFDGLLMALTDTTSQTDPTVPVGSLPPQWPPTTLTLKIASKERRLLEIQESRAICIRKFFLLNYIKFTNMIIINKIQCIKFLLEIFLDNSSLRSAFILLF